MNIYDNLAKQIQGAQACTSTTLAQISTQVLTALSCPEFTVVIFRSSHFYPNPSRHLPPSLPRWTTVAFLLRAPCLPSIHCAWGSQRDFVCLEGLEFELRALCLQSLSHTSSPFSSGYSLSLSLSLSMVKVTGKFVRKGIHFQQTESGSPLE
jgi:hypothetical protein